MFADILIFGGSACVGICTCILLRGRLASNRSNQAFYRYIERIRLLHKSGSLYGRVTEQIGKHIGVKSQVSTIAETNVNKGDRVYLFGGAMGSGYKAVAEIADVRETGELDLTLVDNWREHDRRLCERYESDMAIMCDDYPMQLVDIASEGCRTVSTYFLKPGEECLLYIGLETVAGIVLSCSPVGEKHVIRFLFVTPICVKSV